MAVKEDILAYLDKEKELILKEQESLYELSAEEKTEKGILIPRAEVKEINTGNSHVTLSCSENNSKFRAGDKVNIGTDSYTVVENGLDEITLLFSGTSSLQEGKSYDIEAAGVCLIDNIISLLNTIGPGVSGYAFLVRLSPDRTERETRPIGQPAPLADESARSPYDIARERAAGNPSFYCIQGPPGSGKTTLLAQIASNFADTGKKILIVANTHQAVNNALNAVSGLRPDLFTAKIGHWLKRDVLNKNVAHFKNLWTCSAALKKEQDKVRKNSPVVGMTFLAAVLEIGLQTAGFSPDVVLIDEASQIPMPYASVLGRFMAPTMIFFGDEKQMPPIFRTELRDSPFSTSIFEHLKRLYPEWSVTLNKTFRMNNEICRCVQQNFYPETDLLPADEEIAGQRLSSILNRKSEHPDTRIRNIFNDDRSIQVVLSSLPNCADQNPEEAETAKEIVLEAMKLLKDEPQKRIAVIAPFRRQVRLIRSLLRNAGSGQNQLPLIDTVERLQGQQVDMIVLSFCSSSPEYIQQVSQFLFNRNRINVMISRAKMKVIVLGCERILNRIPWF